MPVRSGMVNLVRRLRLLVSDPAGTSQIFSDDELQEALDARREEFRYRPLAEGETRAAGGAVSYLTFAADRGNWEETAVLTDNAANPLTPSASDWQVGRWEFSSEPDYPVLITGRAFDLYGAAADVLEQWASKLKLEFSFGTWGQRFERDQQVSMLLTMAERYRRRQRTTAAAMTRTDVALGAET